ncbi:MAG: hypothetical protein KF716_16325 [Anaerolineae bacterium]|nr:hypothetical protein [Anaerolineae bacterium]
MTVFQANDVKAWLVALIAHPHLNGRVPIEAGVSFPTLSLDVSGDLLLDAFHYMVLRDVSGKPSRYATYSRVQLRARDLALLHFETFDETVLFHGLSLDAPYTTQATGFYELRERSQLKNDLHQIFARLVSTFVIGQPAGENGALFLRQYSRLLPPSLMAYYRGLNPSFFDWLRGSVGA